MNKIIFCLCLLIVGCVSSVGCYSVDKTAIDKADMTFTGIPTVFGFGTMGTTIPINSKYSLTAAHVAKFSMYRVKSYHPHCDVAIVYRSNDKIFDVYEDAKLDTKIDAYGFSGYTALPVSSTGVVSSRNVLLENIWNDKQCFVDATTNGSVSGMSGGPMFHDGKIVGVLVANGKLKKNDEDELTPATFFVPYRNFKDWLEDNTKQ